MLLADGAEVARADEDDHLVLVASLFDRVVHAEAGEAEILRHAARELVAAVVELVRVELERRGSRDASTSWILTVRS